MRFAGHESFHCRSFWLKKGYDLLNAELPFKDEATLQLGVGRNMVASIKHWVKSFGLVDLESEEIKKEAALIFSDDGWDPFLEDEGTLWLLHYWVVSSDYASIYSLIFNELRKKKPLFTLEHFISLVRETDKKTSESTLKKDFQAFQRTYVSKENSKDLDDSYSGLLTELNIVKEPKKDKLQIESTYRNTIPKEIILYCILSSNLGKQSLSFEILYSEKGSVGSVFALSREGLNSFLESISEEYEQITYSNEAGIRELQIKSNIDPIDVLRRYYEQ